MQISTIIAPPGVPQVHAPKPSQNLVFDVLDDAILNRVRAHGRYGVKIWKLVNEISSAQNPTSRQEARSIRLQLLRRISRLLKLNLLFRVGRIAISVVRLPKASVARRRKSNRGSTISRPTVEVQQSAPKPPRIKSLQTNNCAQCASSFTEKTQSDTKAKNQGRLLDKLPFRSADADSDHVQNNQRIRAAGVALSRLPRQPKRKWSGFVNGTRIWRGRKILLPDGVQAYCYGARKGKVVWSLHSDKLIGGFCGEPWEWGVLPQQYITLVKHEAAVTLGRLKFGRKERPSEVKKRTARANGRKPCRQGRKRGRPSKPAFHSRKRGIENIR
jgi:hypothetical protein